MSNTDRHYRVVELDKILKMLAGKCSCEDAAELALKLEPSNSLNEINKLLKETEDAHMLSGRFGSPSFGGIHSVSNALRRAQAGSVLTMHELLRIAGVLAVIRKLRDWRAHSEGVLTSLDGMFMALTPNKFLEEKITQSILSEDEMSDHASVELANIRRKIKSAQTKARDQLEKMVRSPSYQKYLQDNIITIRDGRFVIPVKAECRGSIPGLVHDTSSSGSTVFIEPMGAVEANNDIKVLKSKEEAEIERILTNLSAEAGGFADSIISSYNTAIELDLIFAKANLGYSMKATIPIMNEIGIIDLKKARHPLIDPNKVVATDIRLGSDFDTLVITGPNTGGKTVTLKTIGLFTLMAMCGLMIPAYDNSRLCVFREVLADIGDEQSIEQSLSTFSAHMSNINGIVKTASEKSLILLDELGAGTDPVEGAALAMSILEFLAKKGAKIAATTHYSELKDYAINTERVENGCCEFDVATLRPTYRLLIGVPGRSNAFAISERLGIPSEIIDNAREFVSGEDRRFEDTVERLEKYRNELEIEREEVERLKEEAEKALADSQEQKNKLEKDIKSKFSNATNEANRIVENARRQAQALLEEVDELRKLKSSTEAAVLAEMAKKDLRARIKKIDDIIDPVVKKEKDEYNLPRALKAGDNVLISDIDKKGVVVTPPDAKGIVEVQAGIMKMRVNVGNLRLMDEKKVTVNNKRRNVRTGDKTLRNASMEIDIRGETVEEAILDVDLFIDSSVMVGLEQITIIHGKGTGALRSGIHRHLKGHPNVRTFRLGVYGEGENGVTIVELK